MSPVRAALAGLVAGALLVGGVAASSEPAEALQSRHDRLVSETPAPFTPHFLDGQVNSMAEVGEAMVVGGSFLQASQTKDGTPSSRSRAAAFNATSGQLLDFAPELDGDVKIVIPGPTANTAYLGGAFKTVNGVASKALALVDVTTGALVPGWNSPYLNGQVDDMALIGEELVAGGSFTFAGGGENKSTRLGLASFDARSGQLTDWMTVALEEHHNFNGSGARAPVGVEDFDVSPDGSRMVVIGNFRRAGGLERRQIALLDITGVQPSVVEDWATPKLADRCSSNAFDSWVRDVEYSPDGSYFVLVTTGGPHLGTLCDTTSRWESGDTGSNVQPSWVSYTGGDTLFSVSVTEAAVYVGGHQRWVNNPTGRDRAQPGAVPRPGLAALDPETGLPFSWNAARNPRGVGTFDLYATDVGLWVASDTEWIGDFTWRRSRIAFLPLEGGAKVPPIAEPTLPAVVYAADPADDPGTLQRRYFDGKTLDVSVPTDDASLDWGSLRAAFYSEPWLYFITADGLLYRQGFETDGPAELVDPYNDPEWSDVPTGSGSSVYRGSRPAFYGTEAASVTSAYYRQGRLYYTLEGSTGLYSRGFLPESGIMDPTRVQVPGIAVPDGIQGSFVADGLWFVAVDDGALLRIPLLDDGRPDLGAATPVGGPQIDGTDWRAGALFVAPGPDAPMNLDPTANAKISCVELTCEFDASASVDEDGEITSFTWDLGDGATASGPVATHVYEVAGTYDVTLAVGDNRGAEDRLTRTVSVGGANSEPTAVGSFICADLLCDFDASDSFDTDGSIASVDWDFGDGATAAGVTATHGYEGTGTFTVTLGVTDDDGSRSIVALQVDVTSPPLDVNFQEGVSRQVVGTRPRIQIPGSTEVGDALILFVTCNNERCDPQTPPGWTREAWQASSNAMVSVVFSRVATVEDAGQELEVGLLDRAKVDLTLVRYSGADADDPVAAVASSADTSTSSAHTTPVIDAPATTGEVLSFWVDKSSTTTAWTGPANTAIRHQSYGSGGGYLTALLADSDGREIGAQVGGLTASTDVSAPKAVMFTLVLKPAPGPTAGVD